MVINSSYGNKGRIGVVVTSSGLNSEPELYTHLPEGFSLHTARMCLSNGIVEEENLKQMSENISRPVDLLSTADLDIIAFTCTTGSLVGGQGYAQSIENKITRRSGLPSVATAASVIRAFNELNIDTVAITTPYSENLNELEKKYVENEGLEVVNISGLGLESDSDIGNLTGKMAYEEAISVNHNEADAVFISCTGYPTLNVITNIEDKLNKPIISSTQATIWNILDKLDCDYSKLNYGKLFE
jgi:maleate isomerase